ncbi:MAG: hypothetical protein RSE96_08870, partial [Niameybacter sp.]
MNKYFNQPTSKVLDEFNVT